MYLEVYLDVIFIINFIMDFILLLIVRKIIKCTTNLFRIILGATFGAIGSCTIAVITGLNGLLLFLISYVIICGGMVIISYRPKKWSTTLKDILILYIATFFLGGLFHSLYYHSMLGYYFNELLQGRLFQHFNRSQIILLILSGMVAIFTLIKVMNSLRRGELELYEADLILGNKNIHVSGLLDTGNCLYDPIFGKPVIIIEYCALTELLSEKQADIVRMWLETAQGNFDTKQHTAKLLKKNETKSGTEDDVLEYLNVSMIPFRSIGKKNGLLPAIKLNKLVIWKGEEQICNENVLTGIWNGHLSKNNKYQLILHRDLV